MVHVNYASMQVTAKIVYYGPGLCGKTTNLQWIHARTAPGSRGEMVSLETEADRTLFFDLLPMEVGVIGGMKVRLQLYTVPGQVFYNDTRRLVLRGVDGVVFVADSQAAALDANTESLTNLADNLRQMGLEISDIPIVFQYNKRDLRSALPTEKLQTDLNVLGAQHIEASAIHGLGVFETLKAISRLTLSKMRTRLAEDSKKAPAAAKAATPAAEPTKRKAPAAARAAKPEESPLARLLADVPADGALDVEFAEEDTDKHQVRPVSTKPDTDIQRELAALRARPEPPAAPRPPAAPKAPVPEEPDDTDRLFNRLSSPSPTTPLTAQALVRVAAHLLRHTGSIRVHLAFDGPQGEEILRDVASFDLRSLSARHALTLQLELRLRPKA